MPATDVFATHENAIAAYEEGGWRFMAPQAGWLAFVVAEARILVFNGSNWIDAPARAADMFGVHATPDATNRLAVASDAVLFGHAGAGIQLKFNKATPAETASALFQTNWSGRAEIGLTGDDNLHFKVSADGATWKESLALDRTSGAAFFPHGVSGGDRPGFRNLLRNAGFAVNQRAVSGTVTLASGAFGHDGVKAGASGATYVFSADGPDVRLTISAGSLIMPIEAGAIEGGAYVIAHEGTAQARVWQGTGFTGTGAFAVASRAGGGLAVAGLSAATQTNIEFSSGDVVRPQFEVGAVATSFERRPPALERQICAAFYEKSYKTAVAPGTAVGATGCSVMYAHSTGYLLTCCFFSRKRAIPTVIVYDGAGASGKVSYFASSWSNGGTVSAISPFEWGFQIQHSVAGAGWTDFEWEAIAEI